MSSFFIQGREIIPLGIPHFIPLRRCLDLSLSLSLLVLSVVERKSIHSDATGSTPEGIPYQEKRGKRYV